MQFVALEGHQRAGAPNADAICRARLTSSECRYIDVVDTDECRRLSRTVVNSAPRSSAWVACVCLIQWGVALRSFSELAGLRSPMTSAAAAKNRFITAHSRALVMPVSPSKLAH